MEPARGSVTVTMSGATFPGGQGGGRVGPVPDRTWPHPCCSAGPLTQISLPSRRHPGRMADVASDVTIGMLGPLEVRVGFGEPSPLHLTPIIARDVHKRLGASPRPSPGVPACSAPSRAAWRRAERKWSESGAVQWGGSPRARCCRAIWAPTGPRGRNRSLSWGRDASAKSADERVEDHVDLASGRVGLG
jgi:hypothetical protein